MKIHTAQKDELPALIAMGKKLHETEQQFEPLLVFSQEEATERYTQELENPNALLLVAEDTNAVVGYLYAHADRIEYFNTEKRECEIEVVYVSEEYRRKGVAQELVEACIAWAKTKNVFRIKAGAYTQNIASQQAFNKYGFKPYHAIFTLEISKTKPED